MTSGAASRTLKVPARPGSSIAARTDPRPIAQPTDWAAAASLRLINAACSVPPVILEITTGAESRWPRKSVLSATAAKSSSGRAQCLRRWRSHPAVTPLAATFSSRLMRICSALRRDVPGWPGAVPGPRPPGLAASFTCAVAPRSWCKATRGLGRTANYVPVTATAPSTGSAAL